MWGAAAPLCGMEEGTAMCFVHSSQHLFCPDVSVEMQGNIINSSTFNVCISFCTHNMGQSVYWLFLGFVWGCWIFLGWVSCLWRDWWLVAYNIILQFNCVSSFNITFNSNLFSCLWISLRACVWQACWKCGHSVVIVCSHEMKYSYV